MARVVMDPAKLAELLRGPNGPVMRRLIQDGQLVKAEARRLVGVSEAMPGERRKRRHGQLRDSIVVRVRGEGIVEVGSEDPIALLHHEGTSPHVIRGNPKLVFWWDQKMRVVAFPEVHHPGTEPNPYLEDALDVLRSRY